jgi:hypothetical protein
MTSIFSSPGLKENVNLLKSLELVRCSERGAVWILRSPHFVSAEARKASNDRKLKASSDRNFVCS